MRRDTRRLCSARPAGEKQAGLLPKPILTGAGFPPLGPGRAAFGYGCDFLFSRSDCLVHVQPTVAGAVLFKIFIPVITGADDIEILLFFTGRKAAGAGTVPVPLLIF